MFIRVVCIIKYSYETVLFVLHKGEGWHVLCQVTEVVNLYLAYK